MTKDELLRMNIEPKRRAVKGAAVLDNYGLDCLAPLLRQHPNDAEQSLLATIDALAAQVKLLRIVRP